MSLFKTVTFLFFIFYFSSLNAQVDCSQAIIVCGNAGYSGLNSNGAGVIEFNGLSTCNIVEDNSLWFKFTINTSGTLGFILTPSDPDITIDYDFVIFGPNATCGNLGKSIRCSSTNPDAANQGNNLTGLNSASNDFSEGPGANGNSFLKQLTVVAGETYFLVFTRPIGESPFDLEWTGTATFNEPPTFQLPTGTTIDITKCTPTGTPGSTTFDFTQNTNTILGNQLNTVVSYHLYEGDAIRNLDAISNTTGFVTTTNPQTIHVRVTNTITKCFITSSFVTKIKTGISTVVDEIAVCDSNADGNDSNGIETFTIADITSKLFSGVDTTGNTITYYASLTAANAGGTQLPASFNNTPNSQIIYLKVSGNIDCSYIKPITLKVNALPNKITATLKQCVSSVVSAPGLTLFNLSKANKLFTNSDPNFSVSYFLNSVSELANNSLPNNYNNISNPQSIIARVKNNMTNCSSLSTLNLVVSQVLSQNVTPLKKCDNPITENGITTFDISASDLVVTATQTVKYYPSYNEALLEQNEIPSSTYTDYTNTVAFNSSIFARIEDGNDCSSINEIKLIVYKLPSIKQVGNRELLCVNSPEAVILNAGIVDTTITPINSYTYEWFFNNLPIIPSQTNYFLNTSTIGNYSVNVTNLNNCVIKRKIVVAPSDVAVINSIDITDLSDINSVSVNLSASSLGNYVYSIDDSYGPYQDSQFFTNIDIGQHTIYVKDLNGCGITSKQIYVLGAPKFFTPNGDSINDTWNIRGIDATKNANSVIQIFDRYGKLIKQISPVGQGWDGTLNSIPLPSDDYWFNVKFEDGRSAKGHFSLKR